MFIKKFDLNKAYKKEDKDILDYNFWHFRNFNNIELSVPEATNLRKNNYIFYIGAVQTFERFTDEHYPYLLGNLINLEIFNYIFLLSFFLQKYTISISLP